MCAHKAHRCLTAWPNKAHNIGFKADSMGFQQNSLMQFLTEHFYMRMTMTKEAPLLPHKVTTENLTWEVFTYLSFLFGLNSTIQRCLHSKYSSLGRLN